MKNEFTQGEWKDVENITPPLNFKQTATVIMCNSAPICVMSDNWITEGRNEANAKLVAAAPDILEALKHSLSINEQTLTYREMNGLTMGNVFILSAIESAKKAIQKATPQEIAS